MKKLFALGIALAALALGSAAPVAADPAGGVQPTCADIIGDLGAYSVSQSTVFGGIRTLSPTCHGFRYTVVISYTQGGAQKFAFFAQSGGNDIITEEGNGLVKFAITGITADPAGYANGQPIYQVCAAYFSTHGGQLYDAVPDSAEFVSPPTPSSGCTGWMTFGGVPGGSFPYN